MHAFDWLKKWVVFCVEQVNQLNAFSLCRYRFRYSLQCDSALILFILRIGGSEKHTVVDILMIWSVCSFSWRQSEPTGWKVDLLTSGSSQNHHSSLVELFTDLNLLYKYVYHSTLHLQYVVTWLFKQNHLVFTVCSNSLRLIIHVGLLDPQNVWPVPMDLRLAHWLFPLPFTLWTPVRIPLACWLGFQL